MLVIHCAFGKVITEIPVCNNNTKVCFHVLNCVIVYSIVITHHREINYTVYFGGKYPGDFRMNNIWSLTLFSI